MASCKKHLENAICIDTLSENLQAFDFNLLQATYWEYDHSRAFDGNPTCFKLIVAKKGHFSIQLRDTEYYVNQGDVVLVAPYALFVPDFDADVSCAFYQIYFDVLPTKNHTQFLNLFHCAELSIIPGMLKAQDIAYIDSAYQNIKDRKPGCYYVGKLMLQYILIYILRNTANADNHQTAHTDYSTSEMQIIRRGVEYLNGHSGENVRVADLCSYLGISQGYLFKCFQHTFHMSTKEFLMVYRFRQIETQLAQTSRPIHEIAEQFGYLSLYSFSNAFKRRYGVSPSCYRRESRQAQQNHPG